MRHPAPRQLRPLNRPRPVRVDVDEGGRPVTVHVNRVPRRVEAIREMWRIDDEWWRDEISRCYVTIILEGGRALTVYHDLIRDVWCIQGEDA